MTAKNLLFGFLGFGAGISFIACICIFSFIALVSSVGSSLGEISDYGKASSPNLSNNKVLIVNVKGTILNEGEDDPFALFGQSVTYGYNIQKELIEAANDPQIKAVIIDVDSPGGTITGSNAISDGIEYFREKTNKPIIGFGKGTVASGGYWSIVPADKIIVDKGSAVGSIGVIFGQFTYYDNPVAESEFLGGSVTTKGGIEREYITAGKGKDLGSPYRRVTAAERKLYKDQAQVSYNDFVSHVTKYRKGLDANTIKTKLGAYIYSTQAALDLKLIDEVGNRQDAIAAALEAGNIPEDDYQIISIPKKENSIFDELLSVGSLAARGDDIRAQVQLQKCAATSQVLAFHGSVASLCP